MNFLSLFAGVAKAADWFVERGGRAMILDLENSPMNDLSAPSKWRDVNRILHRFNMVGIDLPCNTWSRARRAPPNSRMPQPLRGDGDDAILGLPGLSEQSQIKVDKANACLFGAIRLIRRSLKLGIPGYLENPASSRLWQTPHVRRLLQHPQVFIVRCDMCMYDTQWRKPTKILVWGVPLFAMRVCRGGGKCSRTHKPHLQLTGISGKRFVTEQAQIYSASFVHELLSNFFLDAASVSR